MLREEYWKRQADDVLGDEQQISRGKQRADPLLIYIPQRHVFVKTCSLSRELLRRIFEPSRLCRQTQQLPLGEIRFTASAAMLSSSLSDSKSWRALCTSTIS